MELVDMLIRFGLTRQESKLYLALCTEGELTGYEAAKITGISRSNCYSGLAELVNKGAARLIEGAAAKYTVVPAEEFCGNYIHQLEDIKERLSRSMPTRREEQDGYITVRGSRHIRDKIRSMLTEAQERIYVSLSIRTLDFCLTELEAGLARGLKVVIITDPPFSLPGATVYHASKREHPIRLITDSRNVLTGDLHDGDESTCLYSQKQNLVDLFKESLTNEIQLIQLNERGRYHEETLRH